MRHRALFIPAIVASGGFLLASVWLLQARSETPAPPPPLEPQPHIHPSLPRAHHGDEQPAPSRLQLQRPTAPEGKMATQKDLAHPTGKIALSIASSSQQPPPTPSRSRPSPSSPPTRLQHPPSPSPHNQTSATPSTVSVTSSAAWLRIDARIRPTVVHILCRRATSSGQTLHVYQSSGSGVIIDPRGVVLTNAHVLYPLSLPPRAYGTSSCTAILPATSAQYDISLLFLSPQWVARHHTLPRQLNHRITSSGERDVALGVLTDANSTSSPLFPAAPVILEVPPRSAEVLLAAYPTEFSAGTRFRRTPLASTLSRIGQYYAFSSAPTVPALFSLPHPILAQMGASGGGVFSQAGALVGIITTGDVRASTTAKRTLFALTTPHVSHTIVETTGLPLRSFLAAPLEERLHWARASLLPRLVAQWLNGSQTPHSP